MNTHSLWEVEAENKNCGSVGWVGRWSYIRKQHIMQNCKKLEREGEKKKEEGTTEGLIGVWQKRTVCSRWP